MQRERRTGTMLADHGDGASHLCRQPVGNGQAQSGATMAAGPPPRNVRDVPAEEFIKAYAEHLKANDKVGTAAAP